MQKNKFGIRVNDDENAISALAQGQFYPVKTRLRQNDSLLIVPVMAYYSLQYGNVSTGNADSSKVGLKPYNEMLQVYTYKGNLDSVFYRITLDVDLRVRVISDKTK